MSLKKTNDNKGSYRGAGAYSKDYCSFDRSLTEYSGREFFNKIDRVGDYDGEFTGPIKAGDRNRWKPLADRMNTKGDIGIDGAKGRRNGDRPRRQSDGKAVGGQKVSD